MSGRWGLVLAAVLALVSGFVAGWALRGDTFDVGAFEAVGTWVGALVSGGAVIVALHLGYESGQKRQEREAAEKESRDYTRRLLEGASRAQASRVLMTTTRIDQGQPESPDDSFVVWTLILRIQNLGAETVHDFVCTVDPISTEAIQANPGREPTDVESSYLQAGGEFGATFYVLLPAGVTGGSEGAFRPFLKFTDATGQRWSLDHHRRLTKVNE